MKSIPIHKWPFLPNFPPTPEASAWQAVSGSNFNPRHTTSMPVVKIIAFLEIEQKSLIYALEINTDALKENIHKESHHPA